MKMSTRARYGLRLCFLMGVNDGKIVSLSEFVRQTSLSEKYSEQILRKLKTGGLVETKRGATGGYTLTRRPAQISVNEILHVLDDGFEFTDCTVGKCKDVTCPNKRIFLRVYRRIEEVLDRTTLQDMIDDDRKAVAEEKR